MNLFIKKCLILRSLQSHLQLEEVMQREPVHPAPLFSPVVTPCKALAQYHNQKMHIDIACRCVRIHSGFSCPHLWGSVFCPVRFRHTCRFVGSPPQLSYITGRAYVFKGLLNFSTLWASLPVLFKLCPLEPLGLHPPPLMSAQAGPRAYALWFGLHHKPSSGE